MGTVFLRGRYYSRVSVPVDLRLLIGRIEIRKCLRTTAYRDAKILAGRWEGRLSELFTLLRCRGVSMTLEQIKRLVQTYIDSELEESEVARLHAKETGDDNEREALDLALTSSLEDTAEALQQNDFRKISKEVDELLQTHRRTLPKSSDAYLRLCREVLKARQFVLKRELDRLDGNYLKEWDQGSTPDHFPQPETIRLISEALEDYFKHYGHRDKRTNHEKRITFARFMESAGGDRPVQEVAKADCIRFRDDYNRLPKRITNDLRGKPLGVVLKTVEGTDYLPVTKNTVNLALDDLRHFFSWAIKQDYYMGKNPVDGIAYEGTKQEHYAMFTDDDLKAIFQSQEFCEQREGKYPERYWLILILAFTGARREEVAQLGVDDVQQLEGVFYFDITDQDGKKVKNVHSKRRVPVHSRLLELGLLDYVAMRRRTGQLLFPPTPKMKGRTTPGDAVLKWFTRLKQIVGVTGRKPLHSFRHTLITRLVSAGVPQDIREVLVGHASSGVHGQVYTHREEISLPLLQGHLEKLKLPV